METKRIIMTSTFYPPYHLGGDATHVKLLKQELEGRGHEVHVLHSLDAYRLKHGPIPIEAKSSPGVHPVQGLMGRWSAVGTYITGRNKAAERKLERLIKEFRPDWVHHHNISLLGAGVLRQRDVPSVYTAHDYWLICPRSDLMYMGRKTCTRLRCTRCSLRTGRPPQLWRMARMKEARASIDLALSPSEFMAGQLRSFLGMEAKVLPNFAPAPDSSPMSAGNHFSFVGVLERNKGLDLLLQAFRDERIDAELHVMGEGSLEPLVRRAEAETRGRVIYKGFLTGKALWREVGTSLALVCPSTGNENSPMACIEALAQGVPLLVSSRGGLPELTKDPEAGLVAGLDPKSLADALIRLSDPSERERLAKNAFIRYHLHHEPQKYADEYLRLCEVMIDEKH
jgi:glycosyltransferase involved in cell wall biosynthesis